MNMIRLFIYIFIGVSLAAMQTSCSSKTEKHNNDYSSGS